MTLSGYFTEIFGLKEQKAPINQIPQMWRL